jgi:hypothetical protein
MELWGTEMKNLIKRINPFRVSTSRFDRYYSGVVGTGSGYPTADEVRRDLRNYDRSNAYTSWTR